MRLIITFLFIMSVCSFGAEPTVKQAEDKFIKNLITAARKVDKMYEKKILAAIKAGDKNQANKLKADLANHKAKVKEIITNVRQQISAQNDQIDFITPSDDTIINFTDSALEFCIRRTLNLQGKPIRIKDVKHIKELNFNGMDKATPTIRDIHSLCFFSALESLILYGHDIENIQSIAHLPYLVNLDLRHNRIRDISALRKLQKLKWLQLSHNCISNIDSLKNLNKLRSLRITSNNLSNLSPLQKLTDLQDLGLSNNPVKDISMLANLIKLRQIDLGRTLVTDISVFRQWTQLSAAYLSQTSIKNLAENIVFCKNLRSLNLEKCNLKDISFISTFESLDSIDLSYNEISDITPLNKLSQVRFLRLTGNTIYDLSVLAKMLGNGCFKKDPHSIVIRENPFSAKEGETNSEVIELLKKNNIELSIK